MIPRNVSLQEEQISYELNYSTQEQQFENNPIQSAETPDVLQMHAQSEEPRQSNLCRSSSSSCLVNSPDRFIPQRQPRRWRIAFSPYGMAASSTNVISAKSPSGRGVIKASAYVEPEIENRALYQRLLGNELMGADMPDLMDELNHQENSGRFQRIAGGDQNGASASGNTTFSSESSLLEQPGCGSLTALDALPGGVRISKRNVFTYSLPSDTLKRSRTAPSSILSLSPLSRKSCDMLSQFRLFGRSSRKISGTSSRIIEAPGIYDDYYLNLLDWSKFNVLAVGLGSAVYLWSIDNLSRIKHRLCDLAAAQDAVTCVSWATRESRLAIGTYTGTLKLYDAVTGACLGTWSDHRGRIGSLAWNGDVLATGSRDRSIHLRDIREPPGSLIRKYSQHTQEVCGLKWSNDGSCLASGGNDNKVRIWTSHGGTIPVHTFTNHSAAVKALAWSPQQHGTLASGGGTNDRCLRFWNTLTGDALGAVDTGSQICGLIWSPHSSQLVSTHGFEENQVVVWSYPTMRQTGKLTGHQARVLYLTLAPDGETVATGAGDETIRFWHVFPKVPTLPSRRSSLDLLTAFR